MPSLGSAPNLEPSLIVAFFFFIWTFFNVERSLGGVKTKPS
jgi:hypothetical protein